MLIRTIRPSDFYNVCKFVANTFASHEPMCHALKIDEDDIINTFNEIIYKCCFHTFSSLIEHENNIVSVSLLLPYNTYNETQILYIPKSVQPIVSIMSKLSNNILDIDDNTTLYHFMLGTDNKYANQGYSRKIIKYSYDNATKNGYNYIITDATNIVSQNILSKYFNFQEHAKLNYHEFEWQGHKCFKDIRCTQYIKRMLTRL